jgi:hypothetical protein
MHLDGNNAMTGVYNTTVQEEVMLTPVMSQRKHIAQHCIALKSLWICYEHQARVHMRQYRCISNSLQRSILVDD